MLPTSTSALMGESRKTLPTGTITFLFTDIEGSTPLWEQHPQEMAEALQIHNAALRQAIETHGGVVFKTVGDAFQAAFSITHQALKAAIEGQRLLQTAPWNKLGSLRVRMGLHTGEAVLDPDGDEYAVSHTKNRIGRIHSAAHGGQVLLSQETADLVTRQLPEEVSLKDLGEHYLKGMQWPEHLYQVCAPDLPHEFPHLATATTHPNNLPLQLSSFIGREKEIATVYHLLKGHRLVTLTGSGGTGKTRLALAVSGQVLGEDPPGEFEHGVWLVELAPLADLALIPSTVAILLGLRQEAGRLLANVLHDYFRNKHLLLILDNCEHLIQGAAQFADFVLHAAPGVKILATSREPLGMGGEIVYPVPSLETPEPLDLPSPQSLAQFEAVRLFTERACAVQPAFAVTESNAQAVAQICHRLDGIPLAIELAAARVKVLSAEQIAARLDDCFRLLTGGSRSALPRHQTLHALIDWSYGLLSESERVLFRRLSVFRSGWRLEAAEAVCQVGGQLEIDILDGLAGLVNKSLVDVQLKDREVQRYVMLETIRQYAQEKLVEADEAAQLRDRHTEYFVTFAEAMDKKLHSPAYLEALEWLDAEIDNHRLALNWVLGETGTSRQNARTVNGLRLATALGIYWVIRSLHKEGYDWLSKGLALSGEEARWLPLRARAYLRAGNRNVASVSTIQQFHKKSLEICRMCDDKLELAHALIAYGTLLSETLPVNPHPVDIAAGIELIEEGIAILEQFGDPKVLGEAFLAKAHIARTQKDYTTQRKMLEKSNACYEIAGNLFDGMISKLRLADLTIQQGDYETARRLYEGVREFYRNINFKQLGAYSIGRLGELTYYQDDFTQAETYYQEAAGLFHNMGSLEGIVWSTRMLACLALRGGQARRARKLFLESQSLGRKLPSGDQFGDPGGDLAFVVWMGSVADSLGQSVLAARFLGAVEKVLETFFKPQESFDQIEYDRLTGKLRSTLDEQTFAAAWAEGRKLTLDQALEEALDLCRQEA